jgi:hypothetical protein
MGMPAHYRGKSGRDRVNIKPRNIVQHPAQELSHPHRALFRQICRPGLCIDISPHGKRRRNGAQLANDLRPADISSMNDELDAA